MTEVGSENRPADYESLQELFEAGDKLTGVDQV